MGYQNRRVVSRALSAVLVLALPFAVRAETVSIAITATVASVDDPFNVLAGQAFPGQTISGRYVYESDTADTNPLPTVGDYWHFASPAQFRVEVGPLVFQTDPLAVNVLVEIVNDHGNPASDNYLVRSYNNRSNSQRLIVEHIAWQLDDPTLQALSSTALPLVAPTLPDWQSIVGLTINGIAADRPIPPEKLWFIRAHVTSAVRETPLEDDPRE